MREFIENFMNDFGTIAVFLLIFIENLFPPIPSELILTLGGFLTASTSMTLISVTVAATVGSVCGALVLYYIGKWFGKARLYRIIDKYGKYLTLKAEDLDRAVNWFEKRGVMTVFFCRFIPLLRSLISIPAGLTHMNMPLFIVLTTIGSAIWNITLIFIGQQLGENWDAVLSYMDIYSYVIYGILIIVVLFAIYKLIQRQRNNQA